MEAYSLYIVVFIFGLFFGAIISFLIKKFPLVQELLNSSYSPRYFIVELLCAFLSLGLFYKLGLSLDFFIVTIIFYLLVLLSFIDLKYHVVPDYLLLSILILVFLIPSHPIIEQFKSAFMLCGAIVLLVFVLNFYIQNIKSRLTHNEALKTQTALGEGDIPIIAVIGAMLGVQGALVAIFLASIFAIIPALYNKIVKKQQETPFIPFLSLGLGVEYIFSLSKVFN